MKTESIKMETTANCSITTPKYIEDNFILGNRKYNKLSSGPTVYFVVDNNKNICEMVRIKEDNDGMRIEEKAGAHRLRLFFCGNPRDIRSISSDGRAGPGQAK